MIDGTYDVALDTPRHHKRGLLALKAQNGTAQAQLKLSDEQVMEFSGPVADKEFTFHGQADFPGLGACAYEAQGSVWGNSVTVKFQTDHGTIEVFGTRLSSDAGDFKSSHDYMMAGAQGTFENQDNTMYSGLFGDGG